MAENIFLDILVIFNKSICQFVSAFHSIKKKLW